MRLFIGLQLPASVLTLCTDVQKCVLKETTPNSLRPVPLRTHGHVTLVFLGEADPEICTALKTSVITAIDSLAFIAPPQLRVHGQAKTFDNRATVIYAPVDVDESTRALQHAVRMAAVSVHPATQKDRKGFNAHITLARAKGGKRNFEPIQNAVNQANEVLVSNKEVTFKADKVVLFESTRTDDSDGKLIYKKLWEVPVCAPKPQ